MKVCICTSHVFVIRKVKCVCLYVRRGRLEFQLTSEKEKLRKKTRERAVKHWQHTAVGFPHRGFSILLS